MIKNRKVAAIVLAAGHGKRMGTRTAKQYLLLDGKPVLYYALQAFEESEVDEVVLVTGSEEIEFCQNEIVQKYGFTKVTKVVAGGKERYHSVANGLQALRASFISPKNIVENETACAKNAEEIECRDDIVMIHDGARPFVTPEMIHDLIEETEKYQACVVGTPVKDTIKIADENGFCAQTPKRSLVWAVQTPQSFRYSLALAAYEKLMLEESNLRKQGVQITDDAMVVEQMTDHKVKLVEGSYTNIKLTTPEDMQVSETFLKKMKKSQKSC